MIQYDIIATGSTGNATILNEKVLIDCGVPFRELGSKYLKLELVLLTHIHGDHFRESTVKRLAFERPALRFVCCKWMYKPLLDLGVEPNRIDILKTRMLYDYGICKVIPFELTHNVQNCGWKVWFGDEKAIYATDTGNLNGIKAPNYDLYLIEANYREDSIQERIDQKKMDGQYVYERRVIRDHLSKEQTDDWLYQNMGANSVYIYMHQHEDK